MVALRVPAGRPPAPTSASERVGGVGCFSRVGSFSRIGPADPVGRGEPMRRSRGSAMISGMDATTARPSPAVVAAPASRWLPAALAGVAGCLLLVVATSPPAVAGLPPFLDTPIDNGSGGPANLRDWLFLLAPVIATALGLALLRWWPYLLAAAALMAVPGVVMEWNFTAAYPWALALLPPAGYALAIVALLACAQGLTRTAIGWGACIAALTLGSRL